MALICHHSDSKSPLNGAHVPGDRMTDDGPYCGHKSGSEASLRGSSSKNMDLFPADLSYLTRQNESPVSVEGRPGQIFRMRKPWRYLTACGARMKRR